jgi:hypothetical protein
LLPCRRQKSGAKDHCTDRDQETSVHDSGRRELRFGRRLIVYHALDNFDYLFAFRQSKRFFPETGAFVADNEYVQVRLFAVDELTEFLERKLDAGFVAGQKIPARFCLQLLRIRF